MEIVRKTSFITPYQAPQLGGALLMTIEDLRALVTETAEYGDRSMVQLDLADEEGMTQLTVTVIDGGERPKPKPVTRAPRTKPAPKPTVRGRGTASSSGRVVRNDF